MGIILRKKSMVFVYTAMGVLCVEHANVLKLCYIELLSGDGSFRLFSLPCPIDSCKIILVHKSSSVLIEKCKDPPNHHKSYFVSMQPIHDDKK